MRRQTHPPQPAAPARFIGAIFGFVFAGIGLTVLVFLWSAPFGAWDSPPIFFRVFGSFIAIAFVAFGSTMAVSILRSRNPMATFDVPALADQNPAPPLPPPGSGAYACPGCGGPLAKDAEVSPLGDVKCTFCGAWFNIHGPR